MPLTLWICTSGVREVIGLNEGIRNPLSVFKVESPAEE